MLTIRVQTGGARLASLLVGRREVLGAAPRWRLVEPGVWENVHALPRAFLVERFEVHPHGNPVLRALPGLEPSQTVLLEEEPALHATRNTGD
jgi:hypothetical protein